MIQSIISLFPKKKDNKSKIKNLLEVVYERNLLPLFFYYFNSIDIASTSVEQSEVRFKDIVERNQNSKRREQLFDAEFITADVGKVSTKPLPSLIVLG